MKVISTISELQSRIKSLNLSPVGFVPTMGALHKGHLSLVERAIPDCPLIIVSIFVNPTQFNDKNDLKNYPRTLDSDLEMLDTVLRQADIVFTPSVEEMYPAEDKRVFRFGNLDNVMEALHRPGHFNGVAQIVSRFFEIIKPDIAIFGLKDFQQLAVIKEMVRQTRDKVKIVGSPIIREADGLAMSSRNMLLEPEIRKNAPIIYKTIKQASSMIREKDIPEIKSFVKGSIENAENFELIYFDIVDELELKPVTKKTKMNAGKKYYGCIAVKAGKIRLIDNIEIGLD
ncbi:MAG: pantoate--beta-alanine ligase [Bacteroidetes bacterium]|nr:pantoate--beta-alanine ligase [Bacteroidota bacterium]